MCGVRVFWHNKRWEAKRVRARSVKKKNVPNPARMDSACRACRALVGGCSLLSGVQQSDGLREEAVLRSVGSGPDAAVPSAVMARVAGVSDDLPCFPHASLGADVLEGGKLTSDDVLGRLNYSLQGFPVESGAVFVPGRDAA